MRIGVTITKATSFRLKEQEFHNTYYFQLATAITAPSEGIVDELVATEKKLHSLDVTFKRAQVWTAGGTKAENQMIFQKPLSGVGLGTASTTFDRERAVLIQWKAGFDVNGKQVYLRKWYHSCGSPQAGIVAGAGIQQNTAEIPANTRTDIAAVAQESNEVGALEGWQLCAKSGRTPTGPAVTHRFLEHHQLGEMWR